MRLDVGHECDTAGEAIRAQLYTNSSTLIIGTFKVALGRARYVLAAVGAGDVFGQIDCGH